MSEQKRSFSFLLLLVALLVAGGAGAYFYLQGTWRKLTPLESAKLVPEDTLLAAYIDTDSQDWSKLQQFGTPESQQAIDQGFDEFQKDMFEDSNLNYQTDLKPWVGDVMFAILPASKEASVTKNESESAPAEMESSETADNSDPNLLLVVGIQNPFKAWMFSRNLQSQETVTTEKSDYKGVTITTTTFDADPPNYSAVIGKHWVMADERATLETAIDTYQGSVSLATEPESLEMLEKGQGLVQIYLPSATLLTQQLKENISDPAEMSQQINAIKYAVMGAEIENSGMRIQAITKVDTEFFPQMEPPAAESLLLNRFPSETMALITGQNINRSWETVVKQTSNEPMIQEMFDAMRSGIQETLNLDVDRDIFSWMDGQFALGLISSNQGLLAQLGFGGAILLETSDRPLAEASLQKIDESLKQSLPLPLETEPKTYQYIQITEWKIPVQGFILGGYGWLDENLLLIGVGQPMIEVMSQEVSNPLNTSENFQTIAGSLPTPNQGYFYLDMDQVMTLVNRIPLPPGNQIPPETLAILNSIQGMGVTSHWPESEINQMDMWLAFKPGQ
jgi:hypothetical protein